MEVCHCIKRVYRFRFKDSEWKVSVRPIWNRAFTPGRLVEIRRLPPKNNRR